MAYSGPNRRREDSFDNAVGRITREGIPIDRAEIREEDPTDFRHRIRERLFTLAGARNTVETPTESRISFAEAGEQLKGVIDIKRLVARTVRNHERWGLMQASIDQGLATDQGSYSDRFMQATILDSHVAPIRRIVSTKEQELVPLLNPGLTPRDIFKILIEEAGIPFSADTYGHSVLGSIRRIDPREVPNLTTIFEERRGGSMSAIVEAYRKAPESVPGMASVIFTPNANEIVLGQASPMRWLKDRLFNHTNPFVDPGSDFILFRMQLDKVMNRIARKQGIQFSKLTTDEYRAFLKNCVEDHSMYQLFGRNDTTLYPEHATPDGFVLCLASDSTGLVLDVRSPLDSAHDLGPRLALG